MVADRVRESGVSPTVQPQPPQSGPGSSTPEARRLLEARFQRIRAATGTLASRLSREDQQIQSMPEASPAKWHLAHSTWFFERHVLDRFAPGYTQFDDRYSYLFNTSIEHAASCHPPALRGVLSRPGHEEILHYRAHVNAAVLRLVQDMPSQRYKVMARQLELALHHEMAHQEALLADIKHAFWCNPLLPAFEAPAPSMMQPAAGQSWVPHSGGPVEIGAVPGLFSHDADGPRHEVHLAPFQLAGRLTTNGEYKEFIEDGGYDTPTLWSPEAWSQLTRDGWRAPLYWIKRGGVWHQFTLTGLKLVDEAEPVCHVGYDEAAAFARWAGRRLPTEEEWEAMAAGRRRTGNLLDYGRFHPAAAVCADDGPWQLFGDVWEWTKSAMQPYPRHKPGELAVGEYAVPPAGEMMVLRGGSCLTPGEHVRATLRRALPRTARWQMTGIRLADDA